jgi:exodeoxyribonuclease V gamma subunit
VRADQLAEGLGELLAVPPADPFGFDLVVIPGRGLERWLSQTLAGGLGAAPGRRDGVTAGVRFETPGQFFTGLRGGTEDPWQAEALIWPLLETLDAVVGEPWAATLARHLGHSHDGVEREIRQGRRFAVARRLARIFASYADERPAVLADWAAGGAGDGVGGDRKSVV